ncbi:MAG: uracil-DNA glycosylase [Elusimicrobiales bacterium]|jgi:DNA polymerase
MRNELKDLAADLAAYLRGLDEDTYISVADRTPSSRAAAPGPQTKEPAVRSQASGDGPPAAGAEPYAAEMSALSAEIRKCRKCQLGNSRLNAVVGVGNPRAKIVFVGEGPGFQEDHKGEPFVGRSGALLDKILATVLGLKREDVYIANIVKCHPMINPETPEAHGNDRPPGIEEISACRPYLDRQLMLIKPRCIVPLGSVATRVLLGATRGISFMRGKWYDYPVELFGPGHPIKVLPTYHPAALLRNSELKRETWEDMKMLKSFLEKEL